MMDGDLRLLNSKCTIISITNNKNTYLRKYSPILSHLNLISFADRRHVANLTFLKNIHKDKIDSPTLLSQLNVNVPALLTKL